MHPFAEPCPARPPRRFVGLVIAELAFTAVMVQLSDIFVLRQRKAQHKTAFGKVLAQLQLSSKATRRARRSATNQQVSENSTCAVLIRAGEGHVGM